MNFILIIVLSIVTILILIYTIKIEITLKYKINGLDDKFTILFSTLRGIIKYTYKPKKKTEIKKKEEEKKEEEEEKKKSKLDGISDKINNLIKVYKSVVKIKILLREKLILKKMILRLDFGTGDAYYTGIVSGLLWSLVGVGVAYIFQTFEVCESKIKINPKFSEQTVVGNLTCIFSVKFVYIIVVAIKLKSEKFMKKNKIKGGDISV